MIASWIALAELANVAAELALVSTDLIQRSAMQIEP